MTPASVYDYNLDTKERVLLKQQEVVGGYDASRFVSERLEARASNGALVPISIVRRRDVPADGTAPCFLTGYGAYGYPYPVAFSSNRLSLLERGIVVAIAHIRGGGELGKPWHDAGFRWPSIDELVYRFRRRGGNAGCRSRCGARPHCDRGRQRRWTADGRRHQLAS